MSVCAKFQLSSWSRSDWKVWGGGGVVVVGSKWVLCLTQRSCFYSCFELSWVELRWVLTIASPCVPSTKQGTTRILLPSLLPTIFLSQDGWTQKPPSSLQWFNDLLKTLKIFVFLFLPKPPFYYDNIADILPKKSILSSMGLGQKPLLYLIGLITPKTKLMTDLSIVCKQQQNNNKKQHPPIQPVGKTL